MEQRGGQVIKVDRFFPSSKTCHGCGWKWETMQLSDRVFLCQNPECAYSQFAQDRDHNAALNILQEALRLIGLIDQAVSGTGSDEDANAACGRGVRPKGFGPQAPADETGTTKFGVNGCLHTFASENRSRVILSTQGD